MQKPTEEETKTHALKTYGSTANNTLGLAYRDLRIQQLEQKVKELKEIARQYTELASKGVYYSLEELTQHDKEVAIEAIEELKHRIIECREMELSQGDVYTIDLIAEQFKQGFDVFETPDAV